MKKNIGISYGLISDTIHKQINKQGFDYDSKVIDNFESAKHAINVLYFSDLITDRMVNKLIIKLHKKIVKHLEEINKTE